MNIKTLKPWPRQSSAWFTWRSAAVLATLAATLFSRGNLQAQPLVTTLGGGSISPPYSGFVNGFTLSQAKFAMPAGLAMDPSGTVLFVADYTNNAIRLVAQAVNNTASTTTTFATNGVSHPLAVAVDARTNVYVLNHGTGSNGSLLRFGDVGGTAVTYPTLASGLVNATAMAMDYLDNCYVTVNGNKVIRIATNGASTTLGTVSAAGTSLQGIALLANGLIALADAGNNGIVLMNPTTGATTNLTGFHGAGDVLGAASVAAFHTPEAISAAGGGMLVVADNANDKVKLVDGSGNVTLLYGVSSNLWLTGTGHWPGWRDGLGSATNGSAESRLPYGVVVSTDGSVFVSEDYYHILRHVTGTGLIPPPPPGSGFGSGSGSGTGSGSGESSAFDGPAGIVFDDLGNLLYVANPPNNTVQVLDLNLTTNATSVFLTASNGLANPVSVLVDADENVYVLNRGTTSGSILEFDLYGNAYGPIVTGLNQPTAFAIDGSGNLLVAEQAGRIRVFGTGVSNTIVTVTNANVSLQGIALFDDGTIAVSDAANAVIWAVNPITKLITKLTGKLGVNGSAVGATNFAELSQPRQLARAGGNQIVAADYGNNRVVLIQRSGYLTTNSATCHLNPSQANIWFGNSSDPVLAGSSNSVPMISPFGVAVGAAGEVFASEDHYSDIRGLTGTAVPGPASPPELPYPAYYSALAGLAWNYEGSVLYVADPTNNAVYALDLADNQTALFLNSSDGLSHPVGAVADTNDNLYVLNQGSAGNGFILEFDEFGNFLGTNLTGLNQPTALTMDGNGNIFISELAGNVEGLLPSGASTAIVTISSNTVTLKAGPQLQGIAALDNGSLAVSDSGNQVIWTVNPITKLISKLTGQLGTNGATLGASNFAKLNQPHQLARAGNSQLVIADYGNNRLVTATASGAITNVLVSTNSQLWFGSPADPAPGKLVAMTQPVGVAVSSSGLVFDSEPTNALVRGLTATLPAPPLLSPIVDLSYFVVPQGLAFDGLDNYLFVSDYANNSVDLLDLNDNSTSTFLTADDGLQNPASVLMDTNDNVYVLNQGTPGNGYILEFDIYGNAYGPIVTGLNQPTAFTLDGYGTLFVTEQSGKIRAFGNAESSVVATITNASVSLQGIALFDDGTIAVSDAGNQVIWTVAPITKLITKLAGQLDTNGAAVGASNFAKLNQPHQLVRVGGNQIVAADYGNNRLVLVQRNGTVITNNTIYHLNSSVADIWFGQNGDPVTPGSPKFVSMILPFGVAAGNAGEIFTSESYYHDIRGLTGTGLTSPTFTPGVPLPYYGIPAGIALNNEGTVLYVTDPTNNTVSALNFANNQTTAFLNSSSNIQQPVDVASDSSDNVYVLNQGTGGNGSILEFDQFGNFLGTNAASLAMPTAMKMDFEGDIFVAEQNGMVQEFSASGSNTLANINTNANVRLEGIAILDNGNVVVSDAGNQVIWKIPAGAINTNAVLFTGVLGASGTNFGGVGSAKLNQPMRLAQAFGGLLLIADSGNNRVVVAEDSGTVSKALNSTNATLWFGLPSDPVTPSSPNFVPMLSPVGLAIGPGTATNGIVYTSEDVYKDIRGIVSSGILPTIPPPPAPLNLVATVGYGLVTLTWSAVTGATNYVVQHSPSSGGPYTVIGSNSVTTFTDYELGGSTNYYVVSAVSDGGVGPNSAEVLAAPLTPPPPAPEIGWFDYVENNLFQFVTVLYPVATAAFNNDQLLAIDPLTNGISTYYTTDGSNPSPTNGSTPPFYANGIGYAQPLPATTTPTLIIKAMSVDSIGQVSPVSTAEFLFQVANPTITGNNAGQFTVSDITTNALLYYTLDGTDPTNGPPSLGPVALNNTNAATLSFVVTSNVLFKVSGFRTGYAPSGIAEQAFSASNFVANTISFGFASGEASSAFIAAPGQTFYAPVTLTTLPGTMMYSLQFNITITNAGPNPGPAITPGDFGFQSMLMKPIPTEPGVYTPIPPYMFIGDDTAPLDTNEIISYEGTNFVSLLVTNTELNLLGLGWLERYSETNLYVTTSQDLLQYSLAHDDLFLQANNQIIVGGYAFQVPVNAATNQTYQLQIGRPSATSDGIGAPGSSVYIAAPTNGSTVGGAPINALKYVTVGQIKYIAGSVYPFSWFNAGDFGSSNIVNADVEQVFQSAIYQLNYPPSGSDFFDAMDSCGGTYVDLGQGYLEFNSYISGPSATAPLFDGNDASINQIAFGDGILDVCDVYVTFRRSLDPSLTWFQRYWNNGQRVAVATTNVANHALKSPAAAKPSVPKAINASAVTPLVNFSAGNIIGSAGQTVTVPINATIVGGYPLRVLMLNLSVIPLDGSPALITAVSFSQTADSLGTPYTTASDANGNFAAVWLNSTNTGLTGTVTLGTLSVTIPADAGSTAAYDIHFDHASASPNGIAAFPNSKLTGLLTTAARTNSTYGDGIPDSWRLIWFGTVNNLLSASNACPSGDGVPNWMKYVAGVDPNVANDFPSTGTKTPVPAGSTTAIQWPSVYGKQYVIQRAASLFGSPWTILSTNTGTGGNIEYDDTNTAITKFYRVEILP